MRIATRGSALALTQARWVADRLGGAELVEASSDGEAGDKSRFVRGVERALLAGEADEGVDRQLLAVHLRVYPEWGVAGRLQQRDHGPLGGQLPHRLQVVHCGGRVARLRVVGTDLQRQRPLPGGRAPLLDRQPETDLLLTAEAAQAGSGEDDRVQVSLLELAQAGVDVAVQLLDPQVRPRRQQLRFSA